MSAPPKRGPGRPKGSKNPPGTKNVGRPRKNGDPPQPRKSVGKDSSSAVPLAAGTLTAFLSGASRTPGGTTGPHTPSEPSNSVSTPEIEHASDASASIPSQVEASMSQPLDAAPRASPASPQPSMTNTTCPPSRASNLAMLHPSASCTDPEREDTTTPPCRPDLTNIYGSDLTAADDLDEEEGSDEDIMDEFSHGCDEEAEEDGGGEGLSREDPQMASHPQPTAGSARTARSTMPTWLASEY